MLFVEVWIPDALGRVTGGLEPIGKDAAAAAAATDAAAAAAVGSIAPLGPGGGNWFGSTILSLRVNW